MGEREEVPCGTLRVDSKPGAGARLKAEVPLCGWVEHLVNGTTPLGLCSIRMQRIRERTCEAWLSASAAREPEVGSAWAGCARWSSSVTFALGSIFPSRLYPS
jgi:hypothetical protein